MHIAAAVGTRVVGITLASASFTETAPYGEGHIVFQTDLPCAPCHITKPCGAARCREAIDPRVVAEVVGSLLEGRPLPEISSPDFSAYRSEFLSNGTLIYAPLHLASTRDWYLTALIYRFMWESVFNINHDATIIENIKNSPLHSSFKRKLNEIRWGLDELISVYNEALEAIAEYMKAPSAALAMNANKYINKLENEISSGGPSILGSYHMVHMAGMDLLPDDFYVLHKIHSIYRRIRKPMATMSGSLAELAGDRVQ
jgi:hypothetical protein